MNKTVKIIIAAIAAAAILFGIVFGVVQCTKQKDNNQTSDVIPSNSSESVGTETDTVTESDTETDPSVDPDTDSGTKTDPETDPVGTDTDPETGMNTDTETETNPDTESDTVSSDTETDPVTTPSEVTETDPIETETEPVTPHTHSYTSSVTKAATCTDKGVKTFECKECGEKYTEDIPALGHKYGSWKTVKEATCKEDGKQERECERCHKKESKTVGKTDHNWGDWKVVTEPTNTNEGKKERTCKVCGQKETKSIEKLSGKCLTHPNDLSYSNATYLRYEAPTCTEMGHYIYRCQACGYEFGSWRDPNGVEQNLSPTGHVWGDWVVTKEPDGTHDGEMEKTCTKCGAKETKKIEKTGEVSWGYTVVSRQRYQFVSYGCIFEGDEIAYYGVSDYRTWGTAPTLVRTGENEVTVTWTGKDGENLREVLFGFDLKKHMSCRLNLLDDGSYYWEYVVNA